MPDAGKKIGYLTAAGPPGAVLCMMTVVLAALGVFGVWPFGDGAGTRPFDSDFVMAELSPPDRPRGVYAFQRGDDIGAVAFNTASLSGSAELALGRKMNLCGARAADLVLLPGIGPKRARSLAAYIRRVESIEALDDLAEAPGIGPETVAGLRPWARIKDCMRTAIAP